MDLNQKLAQRRSERVAEAVAIQAEVAANDVVKTEFIKAEARKRLAEEGLNQIIDADTERAIHKEKEKIIEKMAQDNWTSAEKIAGVVLVGLTIWGFFQGWLIGLIFMVVTAVIFNKITEKYKKRILNNLKSNDSV